MLAYCTNIRKFRMDKGMSQQELADLAGYKSRSSINKIEKGITMLSFGLRCEKLSTNKQ